MQISNFYSLLSSGSADGPREPVAVNGRELQELISPTLSDEFANRYFSRLPFGMRGASEKFKPIFGWEALNQALAAGRKTTDKRYEIKACFSQGEKSGSPRRMFVAYHGQLAELLQAGATVCITNIHLVDPSLARWSSAIRDQLNFTGYTGVNCYISPDGSGFATHYDARVATTLQVAGKKRWRYSTEPAKAWPTRNVMYRQEELQANKADLDDIGKLPPDMEFHEVELGPGDLLCLPAGTWHSACAVGHSLALNLYFQPRNFLSQLIPVLQGLAGSNSHWISGPPVTVEKAHGSIPKQVSAYMQERLDEFRNMALETIDDRCAVTESWLNSLRGVGAGQSAARSLTPLVSAEQRLRVATSSFRFIQCRDNVVVACESGLLKFPAAVAPTLQLLFSEAHSFTANDVLGWRVKSDQPAAGEIMSCLQALMDNGILEIAG